VVTACPTIPPAPPLTQLQPKVSYSDSVALRLSSWRKQLTVTPGMQ